jgi:threonine dehydrogenase-like Zn-dependent dehydrogenase
MKTKAVRIYGKNDLRLEEFELPELADDEILASVVTDSICMSTWKLVDQGANHKKAPTDIAEHPIIVGHEFCGTIEKVGRKWADEFEPGERFTIQPNLLLPDAPWCPGYSYRYCGGDATHIILHRDVMNQHCLLHYHGETFFEGSLLEPLSCVVSAFRANYHYVPGTHDHDMGIKDGGNMLILGGTGPMGLLCIDLALHGERKPRHVVVTGRSQDKLDRAAELYPSEGPVEVTYVSTEGVEDEVGMLSGIVGGKYDDIFVLVPTDRFVTDASLLLANDGCFNFFAGPKNKDFMGTVNFYDLHYNNVHYVGTSGGTVDDLLESIRLVETKTVQVAKVVTHVLGLNECARVTTEQREIGGGKKLVYTHKNIPLTKLADVDPESDLGRILAKTNGIWSKEAEDYVLANAPSI